MREKKHSEEVINASVRCVLNEDSFYLRQEDGTVREEGGCFIQMDTVQFFVPEEGLRNRRQRDFDREELRYTTYLYGVGESNLEYHEFNILVQILIPVLIV